MNVNNPEGRTVDRNYIGEDVDEAEVRFTQEKVRILRKLINENPTIDFPSYIGREFAVDIPEREEEGDKPERNLGLAVQLFSFGQFNGTGDHFPEKHMGFTVFHKDNFGLVDRLELNFDDKEPGGFGIRSCRITAAHDSLFSFPDEPHTETREDGRKTTEYSWGKPMSTQGRAELRNRLDYAIEVLGGK